MRCKYLILFLACSLIALDGHAQAWKNYPFEPAGSLIKFPKDEGRHTGEPVEWWYTIGHLTSTSGNHYSYMLTYFYAPQGPYQGFRIFNVTNDDTGEFYDETQPVNYAVLATDSLNILAKTGLLGTGTEFWRNKMDGAGQKIPFEYQVSATAAQGALNLEYVSLKSPLILGDDGLFPQGSTNYTYYYSQTKNSVTGTFKFKGVTETVTGTSWIDRQYGNFNPYTGEKYEWFCVQLSNGMDLNLWNLFTVENTLPDTLTYRHISVYVNDDSSYTTANFNIERLAYYFTPDNARCYAQKWRLTSPVNNMDLVITTNHNDSEVNFPLMRFYEGATTLEGTVNGAPVTGIGFAELLHAYENPVLEVPQPANDEWNKEIPVTWMVTNRDEGRNMRYDLSYSIDNKVTFLPIANGLTDTSFLWSDAPLQNNDLCWFKVSAYSVDTVLTGESVNTTAFKVTIVATSDGIQVGNNATVTIYPNPANALIHVALWNDAVCYGYEIVDITGKSQIAKAFSARSELEINTQSLTSGVYFIRLFEGTQVVTSKFTIQ